MDWRRAALVAGAGTLAFLVIAGACLYIFVATLDLTPLGGRAHTLWDLAPLYALLLGAITIGGALPLRALGVPWWRAALTPSLAHLAAFPLLDNPALAFAVGAALTLALGAAWPPAREWRVAAALLASAVPLMVLSATPRIEAVLAVLLAWILLPFVVVIARSDARAAP